MEVAVSIGVPPRRIDEILHAEDLVILQARYHY